MLMLNNFKKVISLVVTAEMSQVEIYEANYLCRSFWYNCEKSLTLVSMNQNGLVFFPLISKLFKYI